MTNESATRLAYRAIRYDDGDDFSLCFVDFPDGWAVGAAGKDDPVALGRRLLRANFDYAQRNGLAIPLPSDAGDGDGLPEATATIKIVPDAADLLALFNDAIRENAALRAENARLHRLEGAEALLRDLHHWLGSVAGWADASRDALHRLILEGTAVPEGDGGVPEPPMGPLLYGLRASWSEGGNSKPDELSGIGTDSMNFVLRPANTDEVPEPPSNIVKH